ncbi:hypothetical protein [Corallococcus llansteffanensis]|uniref:hypothetical protein n=1 Tax=Corallococcus llansteffanensis TaxID=2316731 RepID=UPI0011C37DD1|nr:hypothetical protein [Corallococcus llansteffanensis]
MELQHHKCAYCERPMGNSVQANIDYDVEHFRPKGRVTPWPPPEKALRLGIRYSTGNGAADGYPLLAYEPGNLAVVCKMCNSPLKSDYFPIAGTASNASTDIAELDAVEKPLLIFPLGTQGRAPEEFITFHGIVPAPVKRSGPARRRARVTIDFFELHLRTDLNDGRAHCLVQLWDKIQLAKKGSSKQRQDAREVLAAAQEDYWPFSGCARAFLSLHTSDPQRAEQYYRAAHDIVTRKEPGLYPGSRSTSPRRHRPTR